MKKSFLKALSVFLVFLAVCAIVSEGLVKPTDSSGAEYPGVLQSLERFYPKRNNAVRIMSYNLLADVPGYSGSPAYLRSDGVLDALEVIMPDVIGLQEVSRNWLYSLGKSEDFSFISPLKANFMGTMTLIMYNTRSLVLCEWGEYVYEKTHDGDLRCAVWGVFREKATGKGFVVVNTHLSLYFNERDTAIAQAAELLELVSNLQSRYDCPLFLTGDMNSGERYSATNPASCVYEAIGTFMTDTISLAQAVSGGEGLALSARSVDHVFVKGETVVENYVILSQPYFKNLSDHYPIFIDTRL